MTETVRVIVAGAGAFGREHLIRLAAMPGIAIAGIADINLAAARQAAGQYGAARAEADALELLAAVRPDAMVIATPGSTHLPLALAALKVNVPVLVEKPVGLGAAEAATLAQAESASRAFVLPGHVLRFSDHHRMLREIAQSPEVGPILGFVSRRQREDNHTTRFADVDPVLMTMIHDIDLALWMTGAPAAEVFAVRRPAGSARSDTRMLATGRKGAAWQLSTAWTYPTAECPPDRVEIVGENGGVELEVGVSIHQYGRVPRRIDLAAGPAEDPLAMELAYFVDCIRSGKRPTLVTMQDARDGLAAADAVLASLKSGAVARVA